MVVMNPYFQHGDGIGNASEKYLYEDLIIEGLKIYGNLQSFKLEILYCQERLKEWDTCGAFKSC